MEDIFYDVPSYFWNKVDRFDFPVFFRQSCVICVIFVSKKFGLVYNLSLNDFFNPIVNLFCVIKLGWSEFSLMNYLAINISHLKDNVFNLCRFLILLIWWRKCLCFDYLLSSWCFARSCKPVLFLLNILLRVWLFGKWLSVRWAKDWLILLVTILLYGELYNIALAIFFFLIIFLNFWI